MSPLVIAHRGASAYRPELTLSAFSLAFRLGADGIELDLLATRDGHLVCRHDLELSATTDVAEHPELAHLRRTREVDGARQNGWFVPDLALAEIRSLRARERWPKKRRISATYDGRFAVPTLAEALQRVEDESARRGRQLQVFAELKHPAELEELGLDLPELLDGVRRAEVTWLSFDDDALRAMGARGHRRLVHNRESTPTSREVRETATWADAIGVRRDAVAGEHDGVPTGLVAQAHRLGLGVHVWSHRPENKHLPLRRQIGGSTRMHGDAFGAALELLATGVDGLISDVPEVVVRAREGLTRLAVARA